MPMIPESQVHLVDLFRRHACLSIEDFWLRCFQLGGMSTPWELDAFLHESSRATKHEYNLMALALNEYFVVHGHEKVRTYGHERSALMATKSPQFWPPKVRTPH